MKLSNKIIPDSVLEIVDQIKEAVNGERVIEKVRSRSPKKD